MVANLVHQINGEELADKYVIQADRWNQKGYFENKEFVILNNSILLGRYAPSSIFLRYPPNTRNQLIRSFMAVSNIKYLSLMLFPDQIQRRANTQNKEMEFLVHQFYGQIIKDPRFSLVIGSWVRATQIQKILYCFRHPYEVAASLRKRNRIPLMLGYKLWAFHVDRFSRGVGNQRVIYVNYDSFFDQSTCLGEFKKLYQFTDKAYDENEARRLEQIIIKPQLRNNVHEDQSLPGYVSKLYSLLLELSQKDNH